MTLLVTTSSYLGFYDRMTTFAQFGPMYRRIRACYINRGAYGTVEALTEVRAAEADIPKYVCRNVSSELF